MPEYLLTGRNPAGRNVTERLDAESADLAVQVFRDRGYSEIVLHTDDVSAHYTRQSEVDEHISPREYIALRRFKGYHPAHIFFMVRKLFNWKLFAVALVLLVVRCFVKKPWRPFDIVFFLFPLALLLLPVSWVLILEMFNPARRYRRVIEATSWGRWEEVLRLLPDIRGIIPAEEIAFREAHALAGLGRLDEALDSVRPFADGSRIPQWHYWSRLASVYRTARKPEQIVASGERAAELAPDNAIVLIDLASSLLQYRRDTRRAKVLLERAKSHALSDMLVPILKMVEGILALEEGNAFEAKQRLEDAKAGLKIIRNPLTGVVIARTDAYLAIAYAALGDTASAVRHFRRAEPRLRALRADDLVSRCEHAVGIHSAE